MIRWIRNCHWSVRRNRRARRWARHWCRRNASGIDRSGGTHSVRRRTLASPTASLGSARWSVSLIESVHSCVLNRSPPERPCRQVVQDKDLDSAAAVGSSIGIHDLARVLRDPVSGGKIQSLHNSVVIALAIRNVAGDENHFFVITIFQTNDGPSLGTR